MEYNRNRGASCSWQLFLSHMYYKGEVYWSETKLNWAVPATSEAARHTNWTKQRVKYSRRYVYLDLFENTSSFQENNNNKTKPEKKNK